MIAPATVPPTLPSRSGRRSCTTTSSHTWRGLLLVLGLFARPAAFLSSGLMAAAYFIGHAGGGFWPSANGGEAAILYCFIFLYILVAGPGAWELDNRRTGTGRVTMPA